MDLFDYMREQNREKESPLASRLRPATLDEMLEVSGVGEHKLEKYGDRFLEILRKE